MKKIFLKDVKPRRDWEIIVSVFALAFVVITFFAWRVYLSNQIGGGYFGGEKVSDDSYIRVIDRGRLEKCIETIKERTLEYEKFKNRPSSIVGPSI